MISKVLMSQHVLEKGRGCGRGGGVGRLHGDAAAANIFGSFEGIDHDVPKTKKTVRTANFIMIFSVALQEQESSDF